MKTPKLKSIIQNKNFNEIIKGGGLAFVFRVLGSIVSLLLSLYISRELGAEYAGYYFFIVSLVLFLSSLASFGLQNVVLKEVSIHEQDVRYVSNLMTKAFVLITVGCSIIYIVGFSVQALWGNVHYIVDEYYLYVFVTLPFFSLMFVFSSYFQARNQIVYSMVMLNLGYQFTMLISLVVVDFSTLDTLLLVFSLSVVVVVVSALFVFFIKHKNRIEHSGYVTYSYIINLSVPMMLTQIVSQLNNFSGQFLLSVFASPKDIGLFSVSLRIATLMTFMTLAVNRVAAPKFAKLYNENKLSELKDVVVFTNRLLFVFSLPLLLVVVVFGKELLALFGSEFSDAYLVLVVVTFGQFFASVTGTVIFLLQMTGHHRQLKNNVVFSAMVSILIGSILIPTLGINGAAVMTFISLATTNLLSCLSAKRLLGINPIKLI